MEGEGGGSLITLSPRAHEMNTDIFIGGTQTFKVPFWYMEDSTLKPKFYINNLYMTCLGSLFSFEGSENLKLKNSAIYHPWFQVYNSCLLPQTLLVQHSCFVRLGGNMPQLWYLCY
jgi:hypothetical protein